MVRSEYFKKKVILGYLYEQLTGNFMGFFVGMSATSLVSHFFETRSIRNLWGLTSKKTVVDKATFGNLEWVISLVIGFIVFEVMTKVVKEKLDRNYPLVKSKFLRFIVATHFHHRMRYYSQKLRKVHVISAMNLGMRNAIGKLSKR